MCQEFVVCINNGGSGDNFVIGDAGTGKVLVDDKVRPTGRLPTSVDQQLDPRGKNFKKWLDNQSALLSNGKVVCVVSRGPAIRPDAYGQPNNFGIYQITSEVITAIEKGHVFTVHASQLGPIIALEYAQEIDVPAIFADPISGQTLPMMYRLSGHPEVSERRPLGHWLNIHYTLEHEFGTNWKQIDNIICHFGTGFTIAGFSQGRLVNVNDANAGGPFSDTRAGTLPTEQLIAYTVKQSLAGRTTTEICESLQNNCGLAGYLNMDGLKEVLRIITRGNTLAKLVYERMIMDIASEIAARHNELSGQADRIILTGGMATSEKFCNDIREAIAWFCPSSAIVIFPGSFEAVAMLRAAKKFLEQPKQAVKYGPLP